MAAIADVRELSALAYGFIASKVLFAALNAKLFDCLADGPHSLDELAATSGVAVHRLDTLLTACVSVGLVERRQNGLFGPVCTNSRRLGRLAADQGDAGAWRSDA